MLFGFQVKKWIGAFSTMLGRLDILVFADGIGENAPRGCAQICYGLGFLGIELEKTKLGQRSRGFRTANVKQVLRNKLLDHKGYIHKHGEDMPEIRNWHWGLAKTGDF